MKRFISVTVILACMNFIPSCIPDGTTDSSSGDDKTDKVIRLSEFYSPTSFLIKFDQPLSQEGMESFSKNQGVCLTKVFPSMPGKEALEKQFGLDCWYEAEVPEGRNIDALIQQTARVTSVKMVEYNSHAERIFDGEYEPAYPVTKAASGSFNDPYLIAQWHYKNTGDMSVSPKAVAGADVNVYDVWNNLTCGDPDIIVAVIDEAVKYTHPDLKDNMWVNTGEIPGNNIDDDGNGYIDDVYGYNFVRNGALNWEDPQDSGHGTHCAGTIAAVNNNAIGVSGIAGGSGKGDGCRIMSCQIFSGKTGATAMNTAKAIKYAADMGASIISCSYGFRYAFTSDNDYISSQKTLEIDAIHYFEASKNNPVLNGNIAIFSAGNDADNFSHYPGAFVDIISVSAFGPDFLPTYYTDYGPGCNIAAPGGEYYHISNSSASEVLSTLCSETNNGNDYGYMQGTSMACPHVSGVVALGLSYAKKIGKTFDRDLFKRMILSSTNDIDQRIANTSEKTYGSGRTPLKMAPYYHQMGTGAIDAWRLMMNIEGTPSSSAQIGKTQWISLESLLGSSSVSLTYLDVDIPQSTIDALGLQKITGTSQSKYPCVPEGESYGYVQFGRLYIHPTKIGSGKLTIKAVGGGDHLGGGDNPPGGMELAREISIIARDVPGGNGTGGWL